MRETGRGHERPRIRERTREAAYEGEDKVGESFAARERGTREVSGTGSGGGVQWRRCYFSLFFFFFFEQTLLFLLGYIQGEKRETEQTDQNKSPMGLRPTKRPTGSKKSPMGLQEKSDGPSAHKILHTVVVV